MVEYLRAATSPHLFLHASKQCWRWNFSGWNRFTSKFHYTTCNQMGVKVFKRQNAHPNVRTKNFKATKVSLTDFMLCFWISQNYRCDPIHLAIHHHILRSSETKYLNLVLHFELAYTVVLFQYTKVRRIRY